MQPIAYIENDFTGKFGIPRQSLLTESMISTIRFIPPYDVKEAFDGLEEFSHLWLVWVFSENLGRTFNPTVRPPVLGGNERKGVFATRSPFRPNPIGLTCVKLEQIREEDGKVSLVVSGADLMNGTPILDIKPYIPYADAHPEAQQGFAPNPETRRLQVEYLAAFPDDMSETRRKALTEILAADPHPQYQHDPNRVYGMNYGKWNVRFSVNADKVTLLSFEESMPHES